MYNLNYQETRAALVKVFAALRKQNLIAKMNHMCCSTCACADLGPKVTEKGADGAVYFHRQDNDGFKECGELHLRYFSENDDNEKCIEIAHKIQAELGKVKIPSVWDGDTAHTIQIFCHGGF